MGSVEMTSLLDCLPLTAVFDPASVAIFRCFVLMKSRSRLSDFAVNSQNKRQGGRNGEEPLRKGVSQQTKQRTGLALLFEPKCGDQQRKRNDGRTDIKTTKRMAGSTETPDPLFHAWRGEDWCMHGESKATRTVCVPITLFMVCCCFCCCCFFIYLQSCSKPICLITTNR